MSNQQQPQDEFGGFGESDNQTFMHGKSQQSAPSDAQGERSTSDSSSGFISYVQPDGLPEEEKTSTKKIGLIAVLTLSVLALLWFVLPNTSDKQPNEQIAKSADTISEIEKAIERDKQILDETREQDSLARVQDYLARMQLAQGKSIGNNERNEDQIQEQSEVKKPVEKPIQKQEPIAEQVPIEQKAPAKKVAPPDPVPAKSYPEYNEKGQGNQSPSIQKDRQPAPIAKVENQPKQQPMPKVDVKRKEQVVIAKKDQIRPKSEKKPAVSKSTAQQQVLNETFDDPKKIEKKDPIIKQKIKTTGAEYSVQVMASISKDEADVALRKLKSKGVSSAFMSKRSLKGKTWYRVRFGGYSERDQAENAARKAGYTNAWVERVK